MVPRKQPSPLLKTGGERNLHIAFAATVVLAIVLLSFLPSSDKNALHTRGMFHYWGHLAIFTVLAYSVVRTSRSREMRIILFLLALAFGIGIELTESVVYDMVVEWPDVFADSLGVAVGTILAFVNTSSWL